MVDTDMVPPMVYLLGPNREHLEAHEAVLAKTSPGHLAMVVDDPEGLRLYAIVTGDTVRLCGLGKEVLDSQARDKTDWAVAIQGAVANHGLVHFIKCTHDVWAAAQARKSKEASDG